MMDEVTHLPDEVIDSEFKVEKCLSLEKYAAAFEPLENLAKAYETHPPKVSAEEVDKSEFLDVAISMLSRIDTKDTFTVDEIIEHLRLISKVRFGEYDEKHDHSENTYPKMWEALSKGDTKPAFREFVSGALNDYELFKTEAFSIAIGASDTRTEKLFKRETNIEVSAVNAAENLYRAAVVAQLVKIPSE